MRDHTKLRAFELADELAVSVCELTRGFPKEELYGLVSQMRRAAVSVPSNIVEGCARDGEKDYIRFLGIAFGSLRELNYQFSLAKRLGYFGNKNISDFQSKLLEAEKVMNGLIRSLERSNLQSKHLQPSA